MIYLNDLVSPANRLVVALLRSPIHRVASGGLMLLEWEGRSSGKRYCAPVGYQRRGDSYVVLLSKPREKTWWKNFRQPWPAQLVIKRQQIEVTGTLITACEDFTKRRNLVFIFSIISLSIQGLIALVGHNLSRSRYEYDRMAHADLPAVHLEHAPEAPGLGSE